MDALDCASRRTDGQPVGIVSPGRRASRLALGLGVGLVHLVLHYLISDWHDCVAKINLTRAHYVIDCMRQTDMMVAVR